MKAIVLLAVLCLPPILSGCRAVVVDGPYRRSTAVVVRDRGPYYRSSGHYRGRTYYGRPGYYNRAPGYYAPRRSGRVIVY